EDFLSDFPGCLLVVTHDRYFMDRLVDHLFVFEGDGKIKDFNGTYAEYRALKRSESAALAAEAAPSKPAAKSDTVSLSNTERNEMRKLEKEMATQEARKKEIMEKFNAPDLSADDIAKLSKELGTLQESLEMKELRWLELAERS
ncbi:MAG: ABC transporter ATP-binding protein, partial [Saprospiraceae bacterium]|nr:ABC transporter ATP-binding protein [Saprospiraceae bacterium]